MKLVGPAHLVPDDESSDVSLLLPAHTKHECAGALAVAMQWIDHGCRDVCCVGPLADELHDEIDWSLLEFDDTVLTVAIKDPHEASEYFVFASNAGQGRLVALIGEHPELVSILRDMHASW